MEDSELEKIKKKQLEELLQQQNLSCSKTGKLQILWLVQ